LEYYESPGVLPTVERSSLRHDLYRRDFTINTLAFSLNSKGFGRLSDYFGGQQDIQDQFVRVLHNLSFVEDPTRVFRAIRFEQRLGFRLAPHTENLIRSAVRMNMPDLVGGKRLFNELVLIMKEKEPAGALDRMSAMGLLRFIHPGLKLLPETERIIHETTQVLAWFRLLYLDDQCEQWQVYFLSLCDTLKTDGFTGVCRRLEMPVRLAAKLAEGRRKVSSILESIHRKLKRGPEIRRSEIYQWLHGLPLEMLLYLAAKGVRDEVRRFVSLYLTRLRQVHCGLDGEALRSLGLCSGPQFRSVMDRLLVARLDGEVSSDVEEHALAVSMIKSKKSAIASINS
ncbi:MAG: polya polymerase, partial [Deltaproteobacteria bacterium]